MTRTEPYSRYNEAGTRSVTFSLDPVTGTGEITTARRLDIGDVWSPPSTLHENGDAHDFDRACSRFACSWLTASPTRVRP